MASTITREEFEACRHEISCRHCGRVGLEFHRPANGDLVGALCPACGRKDPIDGVQWLPKDSAGRRRPKSAVSTDAVWATNGNHCAFCGKPRWLLDRLKIGRTQQHLLPVVFGGEDGPLIPFCARCQEMSVAALKETCNVLGELDSLDEIIRRIEAKHQELRP